MDQILQGLNPWLVAGMIASVVAGVLHLGCIAFGAPWYRFMGAGEGMARMAEAGRMYPTVITFAIATVLFVWAGYALSAAGMSLPLPGVRWVVFAMTAIYLLRGIAGFFINVPQSGRSQAFWWWSSSICLAIGLVHAIGLQQVWRSL